MTVEVKPGAKVSVNAAVVLRSNLLGCTVVATTEKIANRAGLPVDCTRRALRELAKWELVRELRKDVWTNHFPKPARDSNPSK